MRKIQARSDTLSQRALYQLYQSLEKLLEGDLLKHLNKEKTGPEDEIKLYMELKQRGVKIYQYECVSSSLKKGRPKLALGILV